MIKRNTMSMSRAMVLRTAHFALGVALILGIGSSANAEFQYAGTFDNPGILVGGAEAADYIIDNGIVDNSVGLNDPNPSDFIWLNRFSVIPGAETITQVSVVFGATPALGGANNGTAATIVVYSDPDGGSTTNATLVGSENVVVANANTGIFNTYNLTTPPTVSNTLLVGVLMRNTTSQVNPFPAGSEQVAPIPTNTSFAGFAAGGALNPANLASLGANYGTIESFGLPLNWLVRARGVPEPGSLGLVGVGCLGLLFCRRR